MSKMNFLKKAALLSGVAMFSITATAQAGFEWRGPLEPPRAPVTAPPIDSQPMMMDQGVEELAPVTAMDSMAPQPMAQDNGMDDNMGNGMSAAPVVAAATLSPAVAAGQQGDVISGFGSDLPLVIALQQVVPPGYQYSFAGGVSPGVSVSWEGGKPWQQVLSDMLGSHGLGYRLQGSTVVIGTFESPAMMQQASSPAVYTPSAMPSDDAGMSPDPMANEDMAPVMISSAPRAEQLPDDMAAAHAMPEAVPAAAAQEPVSIRRQKPSSLLQRLGWARDTGEEAPATENIAVPREQDSLTTPPPAGDMGMTSEEAGMMSPAPIVAAEAPAESVEGTKMASAPMVTPEMAPAAQAAKAGSWSGTKGQTLREVLKTWSDKAEVELYWSIDYDYRLSDNVGYSGSYDEAVGSLLDQFATVRPQPYGQLHQSSNGPRVLVVKSYDLTQ